jgi:UDP-N-acetylmuramyl pentapeptide synthase
MRVDVAAGDEVTAIPSQLIGESMTFPLLAAFAVGREAGLPVETVVERLVETPAARRRMEPVPLVNGAWAVVDDRKALPETVAAAIASVGRLPAARKWAVVGDVAEAGMAPEGAYRRAGAALGAVFDRVILAAANRTLRDVQARAVRDAAGRRDVVQTFDTLPAVVDHLRAELQPGDVVLIKGRFGNRMERVALALQGRDVRCWIPRCEVRVLQCPTCHLLERPAAGV